jgi:phenylacetate-CoA ligase
MNTRALLNRVQAAPPLINLLASTILGNPNFIYGKGYSSFKAKYQEYYNSYDNTNDLLLVVNAAIKNVPFYKTKYQDLEIRSLEQFQKEIQIIDKTLVNLNFDSFFSNNQDKQKFDLLTTGGTSGKPLNLFLPKSRFIQELGTLHSMWQKVLGFENDFKAVIKNHRLNVPFIINPITKEFIFDGFNFSDKYFDTIYEAIQKYKIKYLLCYPSSGYEFGRYLVNNNKELHYLKAIIASSENVQDFQLKLFTEKLGLQFFTWYGHTEKLVAAGYCAHSSYFHVEPLYGYCEIIDENGEQVTTPGKLGEIVGTTLHNYGMPLIRYRTGDYAEYLGEECPECGRKVKVLKSVLGRWSGDRVYNSDKTYVTTTALNLHDDLYLAIDGLQYYQDTPGKLQVRIIPNERFNDSYETQMINDFKRKLNRGSTVIIEKVKHLEKLPNGKFLLLISKVSE